MENVENDDNWQGDTDFKDFKPEEEVFDEQILRILGIIELLATNTITQKQIMIIATRMILIMKRILEVFLKIKRFGSTSFMIKGKVMYQGRLYLIR
jgi:hypothetical protein